MNTIDAISLLKFNYKEWKSEKVKMKTELRGGGIKQLGGASTVCLFPIGLLV